MNRRLIISLLCSLSGYFFAFAQGETARPWPLHIIDSTLYGADGVRTADFNGDGLPDLVSGGEEYGATRVFVNRGDLSFAALEFPSPQVEDALMADLNRDGRMEVLTFSEGNTREVALHYAGAREKWVSVSLSATQGIQWMYGVAAQLVPGGPVEIIAGAKGEGAVLSWLSTRRNLKRTKRWTLNPIAPVGWVMSIEWLDLNADGWKDILISDRKGPGAAVKWYQNPGARHLDRPWTEHLVGLKNKEPMFLDLADLNGDGRLDIVAADISEGIFYFEQQPEAGKFKPDSLLFQYPDWAGKRGKSVCCVDIDGDGALEIVTSYEEAEDACGLLYSKFDPIAKTWRHFPVSDRRGIKYDKVLPLDIDGDGDPDLFTTEERENGRGLGVIWYENLGNRE